MQKENILTVGQWCDQWFTTNRHKWNGNTDGGYRNLINSQIRNPFIKAFIRWLRTFYEHLSCSASSSKCMLLRKTLMSLCT